MSAPLPVTADHYWVLGGRWADDARRLPWPRAYGPFPDYHAARACAEAMTQDDDPRVRYLVVADVSEDMAGFEDPQWCLQGNP